jgi:hypothetical protein
MQNNKPKAMSALRSISQAPKVRQYGDRGYKPSSGTGVGGIRTEPSFKPRVSSPFKNTKITPANKPYTPTKKGYSTYA